MVCALTCVGILALTQPPPEPTGEGEEPARSVEAMRAEAARLLPHFRQPGAQRYLIATSFLELHGHRQVWVERDGRRALAPDDHEALPEAERDKFVLRSVDEHEYYYLGGLSPHASIRAIDLACEHLGGGWNPLSGLRVLDIEPTSIGRPRLLASIGVEVVVVTTNPLFRPLYTPTGDVGVIPGIPLSNETVPAGRVKLVEGAWPGKAENDCGAGFDLILLVRGLPGQAATQPSGEDPRAGQSAEALASAAAKALKPGGVWVIYAVRTPGDDGASEPAGLTREVFEQAGLEILAFDRDDDEMIRHVGRALRWDKGPRALDPEADLYATYTIARRPGAPAPSTPPPKPVGH